MRHPMLTALIAMLTSSPAQAEAPEITDRMLPFGEERIRLTIDYLEKHRGKDSLTGTEDEDTRMSPRVIVLHWTGGPTADGAWSTFAPESLPGRPELQAAGALNVSAHYLVDRDGSIQRLMDDTRIGRHVIGLNHLAIGIENVGGGETWPLTDAQVKANQALVRHLKTGFPDITHLIGHHEYRQREAHPYFEELDPTYRTRKSDPGDAFMGLVRAGLIDLGLEGPPQP